MIHILWCKIDATQNFQLYLEKVPKRMQNNILRYRKREDQWLQVLGKLLLVKGMNSLGYKGFDLNELRYTNHNRPYAEGKPDFNISHSGAYVMCALSPKQTIGIDIEAHKDIELQDFKSILSAEEWQEVSHAKDALLQFFTYWTAKESLLKAEGSGITVELDKVHIQKTYGTFEQKNWFLQKIDFDPAYSVHLCAETQIEKVHVKEMKPNQLLTL
jgi:4'-phosphopantetheinyl transferase